MRRFVIGDIHGAYRALVQVLERSGADIDVDAFITIGDLCDGWNEVVETIELLKTFKHLIQIDGNHDYWLRQWLMTGYPDKFWLDNGGQHTMKQYIAKFAYMQSHLAFLKNQHTYYVDDDNRLYVHGGYNHKLPMLGQEAKTLRWDRHLFQVACMWQYNHDARGLDLHKVKDYYEVIIGHSTTMGHEFYKLGHTDKPMHVSNLWNVDTGAGWDGRLTIMDIDTKEYWQSDHVMTLYEEREHGYYYEDRTIDFKTILEKEYENVIS